MSRQVSSRTAAGGSAALAAALLAGAPLAATLGTAGATNTPPAATAARSVPARPRAAERTYSTLLPNSRFGTLTVYIPESPPRSVAIFLSGDGGWELGVIGMARALTAMGAVVIGADIRHYLGSLRRAAHPPDGAQILLQPTPPCQMIAADFEALSHQVQKEIGLTEYQVPVLIGYSSGATVVYATLVQSPPGTFAGALSLGFCADQDFGGAALCPGAGLHYTHNAQHEWLLQPATNLRQPWIALQGQQDQVCSAHALDEFAAHTAGAQVVKLPLVGHGFGVERNWMPQFRDAYARLTTRAPAPPQPPPDIQDLPVTEVHASGESDEFALLLTGDGGWAGLDQELATRLAASGVPTVGLNSLKYFWTERTPQATARDVARVLHHYFAAWNKQRVLLIGYSFGADVLPFVVNRLPPELRERVASVSLLGIDANASFEVRIADWVANVGDGPPTAPELAALTHVPVLCLYGEGESDSICPRLSGAGIAREQIGKGHHFSGEYARLADRILAFARSAKL
jgi:type IV secretory pathway VirJ component